MALTPAQKAARTRWIHALASGEFQQAYGVLWRLWRLKPEQEGVKGYCCLGVYLTVVDPGHPRLEPDHAPSRTSRGVSLPRHQLDALGITERDQEVLISWNDDEHATFEQIARRLAWATDQGEGLPKTVPDSFSLGAWLERNPAPTEGDA